MICLPRLNTHVKSSTKSEASRPCSMKNDTSQVCRVVVLAAVRNSRRVAGRRKKNGPIMLSPRAFQCALCCGRVRVEESYGPITTTLKALRPIQAPISQQRRRTHRNSSRYRKLFLPPALLFWNHSEKLQAMPRTTLEPHKKCRRHTRCTQFK